MIHLITGYAGYEHIKSADDGAFNAAFFGDSQYILESGNQFAGSIIDNNTVRILDGDGLMFGRHFRLEPNSYEDAIITTGTAGKNRVDLICVTYEKNEVDGTEKTYLEVIKGTETEGTAALPAYITGNILEGAVYNQMPLYKVNVEGVVLTSIEPLFETIPTYKKQAEQAAQQFEEEVNRYSATVLAVNLLDNSDFTHPVNSTGFTGGKPSVDNVLFIDKWKTQQNTTKNIEINFADTGLIIHVSTGLAGIAQKIPKPKTGVTFAAKVNGKIELVYAVYGEDSSVKTNEDVLLYVEWLDNELQVIIRNTGEHANEYTVEWAALYEGEYTDADLPTYKPRGYSVEAAVCGGKVLLWTNASPTSEFSQQTLNFDMNKYKAFVISARYKTDVGTRTYNFIPNEINDDNTAIWANNYRFAIRYAQITSVGITFKGSYCVDSYGTPSSNMGYAIPEKIWGIK